MLVVLVRWRGRGESYEIFLSFSIILLLFLGPCAYIPSILCFFCHQAWASAGVLEGGLGRERGFRRMTSNDIDISNFKS